MSCRSQFTLYIFILSFPSSRLFCIFPFEIETGKGRNGTKETDTPLWHWRFGNGPVQSQGQVTEMDDQLYPQVRDLIFEGCDIAISIVVFLEPLP